MKRLLAKKQFVLSVVFLSALTFGTYTILNVRAQGPECPSGFFWQRMSGVGCMQEGCTDIANAKYSYTGQCICLEGYRSCYEPVDYAGFDSAKCGPFCPASSLVACVAADALCPGEEKPAVSDSEDAESEEPTDSEPEVTEPEAEEPALRADEKEAPSTPVKSNESSSPAVAPVSLRQLEDSLAGKETKAPTPEQAAAAAAATAALLASWALVNRKKEMTTEVLTTPPPAGFSLPEIGEIGSTISYDELSATVAVAGQGMSLKDAIQCLHKQGDKIREPFVRLIDWYRNTWLKNCEKLRITDKHRLPQHLIDRGLFDTSRESPLMQAIKSIQIRAGHSEKWANEFAKKIEAEGARSKRIAGLAIQVLRGMKAVHEGADTALEFGAKTGLVAGARDWAEPDAVDFVEKLLLAQKNNYNDALTSWRKGQTFWRKASTGGYWEDNPTTTQQVDRLLRGLRAAQRARKTELGHNMTVMRKDPNMLSLWQEEAALKRLRNQVADMKFLRRKARK